MFLRIRSLLALPFLAGAMSSHAAVLPVANAGFENTTGQTSYFEFTFGTPAGWALYDPFNVLSQPNVFVGTLEPNGTEFFDQTAPEGDRVAILFNRGGKGLGAYGFQQTLTGTPLLADTQYVLQIDVGNITSGTSEDGTPYDLSNFPGYRIELLAGGQVLDSSSTLVIDEGAFATATVTFTTGTSDLQLGQNLGIRILNLNTTNDSGVDNEVDFDNVRLNANAVPEPGAAVLGVMAGAILFLRRSRR